MKYFALCLALAFAVVEINAHGRISDPVQRGSLWRHPEYEYANPGRQPDDYENFCGSRAVTDPFIGACGLCGDSILDPRPRKHEIGGGYTKFLIFVYFFANYIYLFFIEGVHITFVTVVHKCRK